MIWILDRHLVQKIRSLARREQRHPADVVADALRLYEERVTGSSCAFLTAIAGLGASGQSDVAERSEEILESELVPPYGWEPYGRSR